ncbi:BRIX domain, putative [Plasmodium gallinaceum]|uniref:BRIX domain, putative n=1 Tax=Plasmodium gallinaceum TaxID=5849 RepID=A0A1J1GQ44_PLAGA|nr:BRIX domain, putative [Plasmodium gallinaceum]CRG93415.1 BRIX domain, putative [Plasmodium gallinaceum]
MVTKKENKVKKEIKINNKYKNDGKHKQEEKESDEKIIKKTNIMVIKKKGMNSELKTLCRELVDLFIPYCALFYIKKLKNLSELNKKLKELSYKYTICIYIQNFKLLYSITSNYTKLSLTFIIQSFTTSSLVKSKYSKNANHNYNNLKPLLILKNFNNNANSDMLNYLIIIQNVLKNLYPCVNLKSDFSHKPRRVVLYCYNNNDETIYFRQYVTNLKKRSFKKILNEAYKKDLSGYDDVFNYISSKIDINNFSNEKEIEMIEIGPRVSYKLFKITDQDKVIYSLGDKK